MTPMPGCSYPSQCAHLAPEGSAVTFGKKGSPEFQVVPAVQYSSARLPMPCPASCSAISLAAALRDGNVAQAPSQLPPERASLIAANLKSGSMPLPRMASSTTPSALLPTSQLPVERLEPRAWLDSVDTASMT